MLVQCGRRFISEQREIDPTFSKGMKDLLSKSRVFQDCHEEFVNDLIVTANRKEYAPNRYLMEEGQRGDSMLVIYNGVVEVTANGRYICKLRDGSIIGEAALLSIDNRRSASVRSVQKCDIAVIFRSTFHTILEKFPWEKKKFQREMKTKLMDVGKLVDTKEDINLEQQAIQCDALRRVPFFHDDSMHDFTAELAMNGSSYWYKPGKVIIQEGDTRCDEMFVLLHGAVEITACGEFLGRLENDLFGEICVLDLLERRTANVVAATQCNVMQFHRQLVIPVLAKYPEARMRMLEHARRRLMALNDAVATEPGSQPRGVVSGPPLSARQEGCAVGYGRSINTADAQMFAASPIFRKGSVEFLKELSERMVNQKFPEGAVICEEGKPASMKEYVYWIVKGVAEVWVNGLFITLLTEGDFFGELSAQNQKARTATVKAKTKLLTRRLMIGTFYDVMNNFPQEDLIPLFKAETDRRAQHLEAKRELMRKNNVKATEVDFMFMKLPEPQEDGTRMPKTEPLTWHLDQLCKSARLKTPRRPLELPSITAIKAE